MPNEDSQLSVFVFFFVVDNENTQPHIPHHCSRQIYPLSEEPPLIVYSTCSLACKAPGLPVQSFACVVLSSPSQPSSLSSSSMRIPHHCHHLGTSSVCSTQGFICISSLSAFVQPHHGQLGIIILNTSIFRRWLPSSGLQIALF